MNTRSLGGCSLLVFALAVAGCSSREATSSAGAGQTASAFCPDIVLCVRGDHWDGTACRCVPDDAGTAEPGAVPDDAGTTELDACVETVLCMRGGHFDRGVCRCVPDDAGAADAAVTDAGAPDACPGTSDDASP